MAAHHPLSIVLVHGTWPDGIPRAVGDWARRLLRLPARERPIDGNACWYQRGHEFSTTLQNGLTAAGVAARFEAPLFWSGANSFTARFTAADALARRLEALEGRTLAIGHSHGGSVVLQALRQMPPSRAREIDVVTMGTPFVRVAACTSQSLNAAVIAVGVAVSVAVTYLRARQAGAGIHDMAGLEKLVTSTAAMAVVVSLVLGGLTVVLTTWFDKRVTTRLATQFAGRRLHCIRGMSDEAGLFIAGGLVGSGLSRGLMSAAGKVWTTPLLATPLLLGAVGLLSAAFGVWSAPLLERVAPTVLAAAGVTVLALLLLASFGNWFLGAEMALVGLFYMGGVDSAPDAPVGTLHVETLADTHATVDGLRHSAFYHNPHVIAAIAAGVTGGDDR